MNTEEKTVSQAVDIITATVEQLGQTVNEFGLEKETASNILDRFTPLFAKANEWKRKAEALVVTDASQTREMQEARIARLALKDIRVAADKERKSLKEDSLRYGKAVQGVYNVIEYLIAPIEKHLQEQEDFLKVQEAKRVALLQEERGMLVEPLQEFIPYGLNLGAMQQNEFDNLIKGAELMQREKIAEAEAAKAKEREDAAERERLKTEALAAEKARAAEKAKADAILAAERKKSDDLLEAQRATAAKAAKVAADKLAAETAAKNRLQEAENERVAAEAAAEKKRVADAKKLAAAPDKIKLEKWLESFTFGTANVASVEAAQIEADITAKFNSFKTWSAIQINNL